MANTITTPILIVGAGPVGLALALDLGLRGTPSIVIDAADGSGQTLPSKAGLLNERSLELCRRWGIAPQVSNWGAREDYPRDTVYCTSLVDGYALGRSVLPATKDRHESPVSPEILRKCPQFIFDPILQAAALATGQVTLLRGVRLESLAQDSTGVTAQVTGPDGPFSIRSEYLAGCDGAGSTVRRQLGIPFEGVQLDYSMTVVVDIPHLENYHDQGLAERFMFVGPNGTWCNATSMDYDHFWRFTFLGFTEKVEPETFDAAGEVNRALGTDTIPYTITGVAPWRRSQYAAGRFAAGRVLLAGDSAHTTSPTGGHGLNTGLGDAAGAGWVLDALVKGWGGQHLLEAYAIERRPVAIRNSSASSRHYRTWTNAIDYSQVLAEGSAGDAVRQQIAEELNSGLQGEWHSQGIALGYRYENSPAIVPDGTPAPPDEESIYLPVARPGHRAPHVYLEDGRSTLDLFGSAPVLLRIGADAPGSGTFETAAAQAGVPLTVVPLESAAVLAAYGPGLVLVRPDGHVAWRSTEKPDQAAALEILDRIRGAVGDSGDSALLVTTNNGRNKS